MRRDRVTFMIDRNEDVWRDEQELARNIKSHLMRSGLSGFEVRGYEIDNGTSDESESEGTKEWTSEEIIARIGEDKLFEAAAEANMLSLVTCPACGLKFAFSPIITGVKFIVDEEPNKGRVLVDIMSASLQHDCPSLGLVPYEESQR